MTEQKSQVDILVDLLKQALEHPEERLRKVREFQAIVWDTASEHIPPAEHSLWSIFDEIAHDLDYYEPDDALRKEDPVFYGDDRVQQLLQQALARIASVRALNET